MKQIIFSLFSPLLSMFFFVANFHHLVTKKKGVGKSNKGKIGIIKRNSPYFEEKKVKNHQI
jgi:hypothetical protein